MYNIANHLSASQRTDPNYLLILFIDNYYDASKWSQEYMTELANVRPPKNDVTFTLGSNNNVIWFGTIAAAKVTVLSSI